MTDDLNARLLRGIEQARRGETIDRGDFTRYLEDETVRVADGRDGTAFIWLPDVDYLDTQAGPVELGLDRHIAEQLRDALDGWLRTTGREP